MTMNAVIGIDIGGTRIKSAVLRRDGTVLDEATRETPGNLATDVGDVVARVVAEHTSRMSRRGIDVSAVGVVVPGIVDDARGRGVFSANLGWRDLDLRGALEVGVAVPVAVGHDVRAGLLAERRFGAAVGSEDVLFVPLGTGIASATLSGGRLVTDPGSGEIGHVVVEPDGIRCECGVRGCLETVASARAIGRRFTERSGVEGRVADAAEVARLVEESLLGQEEEHTASALAVWTEAVAALAGVLAPVVATLGTDVVLVGGGLVRSGETLLEPLRRALSARLGCGIAPTVRAAALGDRAGSLGAGALALGLLDVAA